MTWWKTWWFWALAFSLMCALGALNDTQKRKADLERQVEFWQESASAVQGQLDRERQARAEREERLEQSRTSVREFEGALDAACALNPDFADARLDPELYARLCGARPGAGDDHSQP